MSDLTASEEQEVIASLKSLAQRSDNRYGNSIDEQIKDLSFQNEGMYDDNDEQIRGEGSADLTFDMLRVPINGIINQYRKTPHLAKVEAKTREAKPKAKLLQGIIRGICKKGGQRNESIVSVDRQVKGGVGYLFISTDYESEEGWNQEVKFSGIISPESVIEDPFAKKATASDAKEKALVEFMPKKDAEEKFDIEINSEAQSVLSSTRWQPEEGSVEVVTYFKIKNTKERLYKDENGNPVAQKGVRKNTKMKSREINKTSVMCYKIVGQEVVSSTELPIDTIPLVRYPGESIYEDGQENYQSMRRPGRGSAKLINYLGCDIAERVALSPKPTTYAEDASIEPYIKEWTDNGWLGVKRYKGVSDDGKRVFSPPIDSNRTAQVNDDMVAMGAFQGLLTNVLGVQPAGVATDAVMNETATATISRVKSSDINNYQFMDNAGEANVVTFNIVAQLLNPIYDTPRLMPVEDEEGYRMEYINVAELGINPNEYEVTQEGGPMVSMEETENLNKLLAMGSVFGPDVALSFADKIAEYSGANGADEISKRLQIVMRQRLGFDVNDDQANVDPQAVQAMEEMTAQLEQLVVEKQGLEEQFSQAVTYINQLQTQIIDESEKTMMAKYKTDADNATKVQIKAMDMESKSEGNEKDLLETQMNIVADATAQAKETEKELAESMIENQPDTIIEVVEQPVDFNPIDGMRNDLTFDS